MVQEKCLKEHSDGAITPLIPLPKVEVVRNIRRVYAQGAEL